MALPIQIASTTEPDVHEWISDTIVLTRDTWLDVEDPDIKERVREILGYSTDAILAGTTVPAALNAIGVYEDLMEATLGYVLEEQPGGWPALVQQALDDVTTGRTTSHESTEAFQAHLDGLDEDVRRKRMPKSESHKRVQRKAAGAKGRTEVKQRGRTQLDALSKGGKATEVERSGTKQGLDKAASRLKKAKHAGAKQVVLQVPNKDMDEAAAAMRRKDVSGTVKNMGGTRRRSVQ